jgi:hypothetical protein
MLVNMPFVQITLCITSVDISQELLVATVLVWLLVLILLECKCWTRVAEDLGVTCLLESSSWLRGGVIKQIPTICCSR